ncbi:MAG: F0F1 ATP synthase subunit delta [Cellvibrionales bacterium TMED49]|nr:MAG: F0F1 ATP synthase subunit delta [Cellvibrionales bacterium TMED49]|tara:strand:- start:130 stop:666 length:537 start_codon:yes stop_codon:yes gene_type:complete
MAELETLARPYSKAAFEFATESSQLEYWSLYLSVLARAVEQSSIEVLLSSPNLTTLRVSEIFLQMFHEILEKPTENFILVLAENRRLKLLPHISRQFERFKSAHDKIVHVNVTTASSIDPDQQDRLSEVLSVKLAANVNMQVHIDEDLIGGAIIRAGNTVIDGSIRGRLIKLAESLNS